MKAKVLEVSFKNTLLGFLDVKDKDICILSTRYLRISMKIDELRYRALEMKFAKLLREYEIVSRPLR